MSEYDPPPERIGEYLSVRKNPPDLKQRRTHRWVVLNNRGDALGVVQWFVIWQQYRFDARELATFDSGCLRDLVTFLERVNREHRDARTESKSHGGIVG